MYFRQFRVTDMGCASYMLGSEGQAVVVDPQWRIEPYLRLADKEGLRITASIDTHLHADHVSGNRRLAAATGAAIYLHEAAQADFEHIPLRAGQQLRLGKVMLEALHTPGHTIESIILKVTDLEQPESPPLLLTGDTLFVGDVGRPDFLGEEGARLLYASLKSHLPALPGQALIYPAHLAGSLCGRNLSKEHSSTLAVQQATNPALALGSEREFIEYLMNEVPPHPVDFKRIVDLNRAGPPASLELPPPELTPAQVRTALAQGASLVDVRDSALFWSQHIKGSLNVPVYSNQFGPNTANFVPATAPLVLVAEDATDAAEAAALLANVGRINVLGYLDSRYLGSFETAGRPELTAEELCRTASWQVLDVREESEHRAGSLPGAVNIPLRRLIRPADLAQARRMSEGLGAGQSLAIVCNNGNRSSLAASYLEQQGIGCFNVANGWIECNESGVATPDR